MGLEQLARCGGLGVQLGDVAQLGDQAGEGLGASAVAQDDIVACGDGEPRDGAADQSTADQSDRSHLLGVSLRFFIAERALHALARGRGAGERAGVQRRHVELEHNGVAVAHDVPGL
jgi:hypothetical protein